VLGVPGRPQSCGECDIRHRRTAQPWWHTVAEGISSGAGGSSLHAVWDGILFDVEADFRWWRLWRRRWRVENFHDALKHIHDGNLVNIQTDFEFLLQEAGV